MVYICLLIRTFNYHAYYVPICPKECYCDVIAFGSDHSRSFPCFYRTLLWFSVNVLWRHSVCYVTMFIVPISIIVRMYGFAITLQIICAVVALTYEQFVDQVTHQSIRVIWVDISGVHSELWLAKIKK